jgi:hypothetical protein
MQFRGTGYDARDLPDDLNEIHRGSSKRIVFGRVTPTPEAADGSSWRSRQRGHVVTTTTTTCTTP